MIDRSAGVAMLGKKCARRRENALPDLRFFYLHHEKFYKVNAILYWEMNELCFNERLGQRIVEVKLGAGGKCEVRIVRTGLTVQLI